MSQTYGLDGIEEAQDYLRDPLLRSRLLTISAAVAEQVDQSARPTLGRVMGASIDVAKLVSSMTLFGAIAKRLHAAEALDEYASIAKVAERILVAAAAEGYPSCQFTLKRLR